MLHKCAGLPFESTEKYNFDIFAQFTCAVLLYRQTQNMCKLGGDCGRRHRQGLLHACILYSAQTSLTSVANCTGEPIRPILYLTVHMFNCTLRKACDNLGGKEKYALIMLMGIYIIVSMYIHFNVWDALLQYMF